MKTYRIMAVILIVLILAEFAMMAIALFKGEYSQFFIDGGVLVAMLIASLLLRRAVKHRKEAEAQAEEIQDTEKEGTE